MMHLAAHRRAVRRAAVDTTTTEHINNVFHLNRRIEDMYTATERKKNQHDPTLFPTYQKRNSNLHKASLHQKLVEPWAQGAGASMM